MRKAEEITAKAEDKLVPFETPAAVAPAIIHTPEEQWLMLRRTLITASDVPAILNADPFRKEADVFLVKTGQGSIEETEPMRWGRRMESAIADGYVAATHRHVHPEKPFEITIHPDIPWLGATLDRGVTCEGYSMDEPVHPGPLGARELGALELKATSDAARWEDAAPVHHQIQLTVQMACAGRQWGSLAAFVALSRPVVWFDLLFDAELFALMVPQLEIFHEYVKRREFPAQDPERFSSSAIRKLWPSDSGESIVLEQDALNKVNQWEALKDLESVTRSAKERAEDELRLLMKDATTAFLPDGTSLNLKTTQRHVQAAAAYTSTFRTLRRFTPKGPRRQLT
jgi:putative phage-type endonuclease